MEGVERRGCMQLQVAGAQCWEIRLWRRFGLASKVQTEIFRPIRDFGEMFLIYISEKYKKLKIYNIYKYKINIII